MAPLITITNSIAAALLLFFSLITQGYCECSLNDIHVGGAVTGKVVGGKPEWKVTVTNGCNCTQSNIKFACQGFQSTEAVDNKILLDQGDTCLFLSGNPLAGSDSVTFYYAWDTPYILFPVSSDIHPC